MYGVSSQTRNNIRLSCPPKYDKAMHGNISLKINYFISNNISADDPLSRFTFVQHRSSSARRLLWKARKLNVWKLSTNFLQDIDLVFKPVHSKSFSTQRTIWNIPTLRGTLCLQSTQNSSVIASPGGRSPADIVGSNPAEGGMDVFCECCQVVVSATADHSSSGVLLNVVRRCAWSRNIMSEEASARFGPQPKKSLMVQSVPQSLYQLSYPGGKMSW
jgi:hypothetical protein